MSKKISSTLLLYAITLLSNNVQAALPQHLMFDNQVIPITYITKDPTDVHPNQVPERGIFTVRITTCRDNDLLVENAKSIRHRKEEVVEVIQATPRTSGHVGCTAVTCQISFIRFLDVNRQ